MKEFHIPCTVRWWWQRAASVHLLDFSRSREANWSETDERPPRRRIFNLVDCSALLAALSGPAITAVSLAKCIHTVECFSKRSIVDPYGNFPFLETSSKFPKIPLRFFKFPPFGPSTLARLLFYHAQQFSSSTTFSFARDTKMNPHLHLKPRSTRGSVGNKKGSETVIVAAIGCGGCWGGHFHAVYVSRGNKELTPSSLLHGQRGVKRRAKRRTSLYGGVKRRVKSKYQWVSSLTLVWSTCPAAAAAAAAAAANGENAGAAPGGVRRTASTPALPASEIMSVVVSSGYSNIGI
jgi:hypothetical protein